VIGGGFGSEGDQVTPTRVTTLTIEVIQHGTIRTTLTVRDPKTDAGKKKGAGTGTEPPAAARSPAPMAALVGA
jgi:hypothetical protein